LSRAFRAQEKVQYVTNFESVVIKPLMATWSLPIRATLKREKRTNDYGHEYHIWDVDKFREIAANKEGEVTLSCGGSRNFNRFLDLFDKVFVLDVDVETLKRRLDSRAVDDWGGNKKEKELILRLHATKEDIPEGMMIDAARPLSEVVDAIVECIAV
jgi:hypothetical protein